MAASDPTTSVPTPTGALQGVAAASWDGSVWQPAGRTGPSLATPTGVLQGVAPFSWDGAAWQPAGRAGPGVATPTGVLEGVAVYTWSGSAWVPSGGTATPSTPSGVLRGVAAFGWDGAAWQPAAQAGPSVATPYGVLQGVAMFNWTGSAWIAASAASLDLSFMTPGTLPPNVTFTRASTATYFDSTGTMQTAATNTPRWDYDPVTHALRGLLIEEQRVNLLLNSATLGTQSVTTTAVATTLSFYGTGTVTLSGTSTGSLVGTGATNRVALTFTPTAGTLTCTVTGSVTNAQVEAGAFATSYIPTTAASVTRLNDSAQLSTSAWFNAAASSLACEFMVPYSTVTGTPTSAELDDSATSNAFLLGLNSGMVGMARVFAANAPVGIANTSNSVTANTVIKHAGAFGSLVGATVLNGGTVTPLTFTSNPTGINRLAIGSGRPTTLSGWVRRIRYWPRILTNAELQAVTT
jgi:hypothetical protein